MNRVGVFAIVLAAAVTGACGGADGVSSSPTGPSSTTTTTSSQPQPPAQSSCVPTNLTASVAGSVVTLQWSAVGGATEYLVLVGSTPSSSDQLSTNTTNNSYSWTARPGQQYARVQARCGGQFGGSSNEAAFTVAGSSAD